MPAPINWFRPARALSGLLLGLLGLAALCSGCHSVDARIHNLGELHTEEGKVSYKAALMGEGEYLMRRAFSVSAPFGVEFELDEKEEELIEDPAGACLEELLALERYAPKNARFLALRTEMYAWLAVGDPYVLARERCVLELGKLGVALGLEDTLQAPPESEQPTIEEVSGRIADLIKTAAPVLGSGERTTKLTLPEACDAISELQLGIPAGRRILRTCAVLLASSRAPRREFDVVRELVRDVAGRRAAMALTSARSDSSPIVRAAAALAWTHGTDNRAGELMAEALGDREPIVLHRVFREIAAHGIPRPMKELSEVERLAWKENWIANLVQAARDHPDGRVAIAACKALAVVTDAGFESLRFEDWVAWWVKRAEARVNEDRVLKAGA